MKKPENTLPIDRDLKGSNKTATSIATLQAQILSKQQQLESLEGKIKHCEDIALINERPLLTEIIDLKTNQEIGQSIDEKRLTQLQDDLKAAKTHNADAVQLNQQRQQVSQAMLNRSTALTAEIEALKKQLTGLIVAELESELNSQRELYRSQCLAFISSLSNAHHLSEKIRQLTLSKDPHRYHIQAEVEVPSFYNEYRLVIPALPALPNPGNPNYLQIRHGQELPASTIVEKVFLTAGIEASLMA
ncbi:hypothetical protein GO003_018960 [Methylicorpusculum oleiharenae]|uniref:hypothetical protein n=1 Tax=Methylicorpusculum oleiharenae TaxID=1338687 RepID=UPI001359C225|nr:hypothetical protein [Methylicorpusculum oleiharenae]MCD2452468.1 hypothetical protein [Methylicorpusculum oleiharenae]